MILCQCGRRAKKCEIAVKSSINVMSLVMILEVFGYVSLYVHLLCFRGDKVQIAGHGATAVGPNNERGAFNFVILLMQL